DGQGLVYVKDVTDFAKAFDKNAVLRYTFKKLDRYSCEVRLEARGQLEGFRTFRRQVAMPADDFPEHVYHTPLAEASMNVKNLKRLFNMDMSYVDTVKVSIVEKALTLETRDDEGVKQFSASVNTVTGSEKSYFNCPILTKVVKSLPDTPISGIRFYRFSGFMAWRGVVSGFLAKMQNFPFSRVERRNSWFSACSKACILWYGSVCAGGLFGSPAYIRYFPSKGRVSCG
ncbi:MAG: hypothetical protein QXK69_10090, partial [Candidatus Caldarchaeum sp.]